MSTIDEALAAAEVVDAVCVIDGETRIISVPAEYKELGVESDEKVTRVKFQCPKIVGDNIDLTEYNLYINYRNAGNKLNSYLVEDATVTDNTINFSWLLSRHVTESPGTISYIVCAKKSDNTGVINEWNTKVATGTVGIGLEATEEIEEQNIDAIEQVLRSIVELENKVDSGVSGGGSGGYYAPSVDADGNLTWTPSKADMPTVDGANIKGPQGKSAYQYAQDGGYTGTETEFAAKLAQEKFANPNALTFTGAVTGTYDGSEPLTVEIPSGGGGTSGSEEKLELIESMELSEDVGKIQFTGLNLSKVFIFFEIKGTSANGSNNVNGQININNFCYLYTNAISLADGVSRWLISEVEVIGNKKVHITSTQNNNTYQSNSQNYGYFGDGTPIQSIEILPFAVSGRFIGAGSSIEIWGVQV